MTYRVYVLRARRWWPESEHTDVLEALPHMRELRGHVRLYREDGALLAQRGPVMDLPIRWR